MGVAGGLWKDLDGGIISTTTKEAAIAQLNGRIPTVASSPPPRRKPPSPSSKPSATDCGCKKESEKSILVTLNSTSSNRPTLSKDNVSNNLPMSQVMSISSPPPPQAFGTQDSIEAITNLQ
ncbi:unnamed protein product [Fraxinus pennsylvanica]|uniref:Uncharacterized protein n=1 Tax=Fraxinus pennsylvanica TaxID=56036 RepID=A0AAD2DXU6_9LAMI|nr:unnamed protein product [Fraxinus pennsylvanica]